MSRAVCAGCGRGITYRRIARDAAILLTRLGEGGGRWYYCGGCVQRDVVQPEPGDIVKVLVVGALHPRYYPSEQSQSLRWLTWEPADA